MVAISKEEEEACETQLYSCESCLNQLDYSLGATSWFSLLIQASKEFVIDERITWVDIEGIPLKLWSESTFNRIAAKWGKMLYLEKLDEGCLYSKRGDVNVQAEEKGNDFDVNNSLDPFELYSLLNKKRNVEEKMDKSNETVSIPFPPGFTPCDETEVECDKKSMGNNEGSGSDNGKRGIVVKSFCLFRVDAPQVYAGKENALGLLVHVSSEMGRGGNATDDILYKRMEIIKDIQEAEKVDNLEAAQKAKIKWAIEGDENTKFYHGNFK
ncbi:hypothetical protein Tco_1067652 [Tanacetum coccineum]|uniref:RNA-directed DNA polymerase, eukaryota n=1 Tax=Tanacetum coccineum TaxID=301880 RepID=A0ABQ5HFB4_9ASTR